MDTVTTQKRSEIMGRIRSKNSKPELLVRRFLHANGFRFRLHNRNLPGTPDIVLPRYQTVILVHGCFWHRHDNCPYASIPSSNREYWINKFKNNKERDKRNLKDLRKAGFDVIVIWECELNSTNALSSLLNRLRRKRLALDD
ncbi:MAG: DNA mismatch endonuclease Vsr [Gammaproteobacteria bacterium]|nr:DNA mismatch endonuclease Vsr [Gammaproteobacteria bacterium]